MKHFRIFSSTDEYAEYIVREDAAIPNVAYCYGDNKTYISNDNTPPQPLGTLVIEGVSSISAETCGYNALFNNTDVTTSSTWSIVSGSQYATINSSNGTITVLNAASDSTVVIQATYNGISETKEISLTYVSGAESETTTEVTTDESGNTTTVVTVITTNEDGSSTEESNTVVVDGDGNVIGTSESNKETNSDGSYVGTTTNYDADGNAVDGSNVTGDTAGNVDTQTVEYDETGGTVVTGYDIDTSGNPEGIKEINGEEVNTEFYAFDTTHAFELMIHFYYDPAKQTVQQATILNAKKTEGSAPWYGFDLRRNASTVNIQYGVQFATGNQTRNNITMNANHIFKVKVNYDPTAANGNTFVMYDMINNKNISTSATGIFADTDALKYIKITIGCSLDGNGQPERRAIMDVYDFYVKRT